MERLAGAIILLTGWRKSLLAMAAGALTVLAQAPFDFPAVAFLTLPVLVLLLDGAVATGKSSLLGRLRAAFGVGWWFGFGYFMAGIWWIGSAFLVEAESYAWALPFAVLGLPVLLALFYGLACAIARIFWGDGIGRILALAFGFGFAEWLRAFAFTGFPWISIGYAAMPTPLLMQSVEIVGVFGMNALAVFVFASPALLIAGRQSRFGFLLAALLAAAHVSFGAWATSHFSPEEMKPIAVRIVQPDIDLGEKWDDKEGNFKTLLALSSRPAVGAQKKPELIVWPETSVPYILSEAPGALAAIGEMLQPGQVLLAGSVRQEGDASAALYYNSVLMIDDSGQIVDAVDKVHLVPFGEYIPFKSEFARIGMKQLVSGPMNYEAGATRHAFDIRGIKVAPYICYEMIFSRLMPKYPETANMLVNVTNDAWFGATPGPYQHLRQAQVRAVETRNPAVRAANTGVSAVIDPFGRIVDALALGSAGTIDALVTPTLTKARPWGDGSRNGLAIIAVLGVLSAILRLARR
jgi:apolipoprotein N-acyltransferase